MNTARQASERLIYHLDLDSRWFPDVFFDAPQSFDLHTVLYEFMLDDHTATPINDLAMKSLQGVNATTSPPHYKLEVFETQERDSKAPTLMQMPQLKKIYTGPNPGQIYDLAAIKFKSNQRSRLWMSAAIPTESNYFLNMTRIPMAHAAATIGSGLLHSALVEYDGIGILLPGAAFSGKSSISVFAMLNGATLISDDLVLLRTISKDITAARSFRRTLLMRERTHNLLPDSIRVHAKSASIKGITKYAYDRDTLESFTGVETEIQRIVLPSISSSVLQGAVHGYQLLAIDKASALQRLVQCLDSSVLMPGLDNEKSKVTAGLLNVITRTPCIELRMDSRFLDSPKENCQRLLHDIGSMTNPQQVAYA